MLTRPRIFGLLAAAVLSLAWSATLSASDRPPIVFASRLFDELPEPQERKQSVERALEGALLVLEPNGDVRTLIDATAAAVSSSDPAGTAVPVDVIDPSVSYDGERIVFSGFSSDENAWRIFEIGADGSGLRQITRSDRDIDLSRFGEAADVFESYDDVDPCYLPDGRICFVSTRYPGIAPAGRVRTTNLYVVDSSGENLHRITTERFGGDTPAVDPTTGKIVYSRWWLTVPSELPTPDAPPPTPESEPERTGPPPYYEHFTPPPPPPPPPGSPVLSSIDSFDGVNGWFLASTRPDGSDHAMYTGFGRDRELTMAWRPSFTARGEALTLFIPNAPFLGFPGANGLRLTREGAVLPRSLGGPQAVDGSATLPDPNPAFATQEFAEPEFFYASAEGIPDGRILVTGFRASDADYDIYLQDATNSPPEPVYGDPERFELDAVPLVARPRPPVLADRTSRYLSDEIPRDLEEARSTNGTFRFLVENIFTNAPLDVPMAQAPPVGEDLFIEFFMHPQRDGVEKPREPILIDSLQIPATGRISIDLPAGVPLFEVLRRRDGSIPVGPDGQVFHVGGMNFGTAGGVARCVGCHAGHSQMQIPAHVGRINLAPSAVVTTSSRSRELGGQPVTDTAFSPSALVDRKRDVLTSEWVAAATDPAPAATLSWNRAVSADEVVVYAARTGDGIHRIRYLSIKRFTVETFLAGRLVDRIVTDDPVLTNGTSVRLDPNLPFDRLNVSIAPDDMSGHFEGSRQAALAEIEVFGDTGSAEVRTISFIRGDGDCSTQLDVNDPISVLAHLFLGSALCCEESGDVNSDGTIEVADSVHLLAWLFAGGTPPAAPWPGCGELPVQKFTCARESCR